MPNIEKTIQGIPQRTVQNSEACFTGHFEQKSVLNHICRTYK